MKRFSFHYRVIQAPVAGFLLVSALGVPTLLAIYPEKADLMWTALVVFFLLSVVFMLPILTYAVVADGDKFRETGWLSLKRTWPIKSITQVHRKQYMFHTTLVDQANSQQKIVLRWLLSAFFMLSWIAKRPVGLIPTPMISFGKDEQGSFPAFPISPKILEYLKQVNPELVVDQDLIDLLSRRQARLLGLAPRSIDVIGLWLHRIPVVLLAILVGAISLFVLYALSMGPQ